MRASFCDDENEFEFRPYKERGWRREYRKAFFSLHFNVTGGTTENSQNPYLARIDKE
jgi:hypothetical protein